MSNIPSDIGSLRSWLNRNIQARALATAQVKQETKTLNETKEKIQNILTAQEHIQELAKEVQSKAHKQVAKVVSKCLSAVFDEPYELRIEFERKRGRTEAEFVFLRDGWKVNPRLTSGGVRQVTSLALRLACLTLTLPQPRRFLCLDEPFQGVSAANLPKMSLLLQTLSKELDVQLLIVTHDEELRAGKVVEL